MSRMGPPCPGARDSNPEMIMRSRPRRVLPFLEACWGYRNIVTETAALGSGISSPNTSPDVRWLVESVDEERLRQTVSRMSAASRHPRSNPAHHAAVASDIIDAFRAGGLAVQEQTFKYAHLRGRNLIATKQGTRPDLRPLLVCAHYDSVQCSPGADDNASGVAALLECARLLASAEFPRRVDLAALDMEEIQARPGDAGLLGSGAMARAAKRQGIRYAGVYNLEMIGYAGGPGSQRLPPGFRLLFPDAYRRVRALGFRGDGLGVIALGKGKALNQRLAKAAKEWLPELEVVSVEVPSWLPIPDLLRSDHTSFWLAGMPAITLTDTGNFRNPHYHGPTDTADTLDYRLLRLATQLLVATVAQHAWGSRSLSLLINN